MCAASKRLELQIDVPDCGRQRALALAELTSAELITAVLQEFQEIEYLGTDSADYRLVMADDSGELDPVADLGAQLSNGAILRLEERPVALPAGAQPVKQGLYLREQGTGRVYKLAWLPAIVGRADATLPNNQLVAVNLDGLPTGLRVSRRHLRLTQAGGDYFVECLSGNPATLRRPGGVAVVLDKSKQPLSPGDLLVLDRSEIILKVIVRVPPSEANGGPAPSEAPAVMPGTGSDATAGEE